MLLLALTMRYGEAVAIVRAHFARSRMSSSSHVVVVRWISSLYSWLFALQPSWCVFYSCPVIPSTEFMFVLLD